MTESLPRGLVKTNDAVGDEIAQLDRARDDELHQLWKAYATNKAILAPGEGVRLENFFWRIWSNPAIKEQMSGMAIANLFRPMSRGDGLIMGFLRHRDPSTASTPVSSYASTLEALALIAANIRQSALSSSPGSSRSSITVVPDLKALPSVSQLDLPQGSASVSGSQTRRSSISKPLPPPILKKAGASSETTTPAIQSPSSGDSRQSPEPERSQRISLPRQAMQSGNARSDGTDLASFNRKKRTSFDSSPNASTEAKRPHDTRDSFQGSPNKGLAESSSKSTKASLREGKSPLKTSNAEQIAPPSQLSEGTVSTSSLSPNSWDDTDSSESDEGAARLEPQPTEWLVDRNFRGKFADSRKSATSQTNLTDLGRNLSVRFLDQLPEPKSGGISGKMLTDPAGSLSKQNKAFTGISRTLVTDTTPNSPRSQQDILPRTRSQLSIMVDQERKSGIMKNAGDKQHQAHQTAKDRHTGQDSSSSEEEGIVMGTGVGTTKVTRKGKKSDKRKDDSAHFHSQVPDPVW